MIAYLNGILTESGLLRVVIECSGVGYEVQVPITTAEKLPAAGAQVKLLIVPVFREDSHTLYGFVTNAEKDFFKLLVEKVSGVGPKVALGILSHLSIPLLQKAIINGDVTTLAKCPGIGKKTAERLVVELKDHVNATITAKKGLPAYSELHSYATAAETSGESEAFNDAVSALVTLGYKLPDADKAIRKAMQKLGNTATTEVLLKEALR